MKKDAFYFPHDTNARMDTKVIRLRRVSGLAGYGLFWCIVEMLAEASSHRIRLDSVEDVLFELRSDEKIFQALFDCRLLEKDETHFWSSSLLRRISKREEAIAKMSAAGKAGNEVKYGRSSPKAGAATATRSQEKSEATAPTSGPDRKERRGEERKGKESDATATPSQSPGAMDVAVFLFSSLRAEFPEMQEPDLEAWASAVRGMVEEDNLKVAWIKQAWKEGRAHNFWKRVITDPMILRKNWTKLENCLKAEAEARMAGEEEA